MFSSFLGLVAAAVSFMPQSELKYQDVSLQKNLERLKHLQYKFAKIIFINMSGVCCAGQYGGFGPHPSQLHLHKFVQCNNRASIPMECQFLFLFSWINNHR